MYLNWLILLLGAQVAFFVQHPQYLVKEPVTLVLSNRLKERLGLQILFYIAQHHYLNRDPWTLDQLVEQLGIPGEPVNRVLNLLVEEGYLVESADETPAFLPRQDIAQLRIAEVLIGIRRAGESQFLRERDLPAVAVVDEAMEAARVAREQAFEQRTLKDLVLAAEAPP